jgi:hypothetical protein
MKRKLIDIGMNEDRTDNKNTTTTKEQAQLEQIESVVSSDVRQHIMAPMLSDETCQVNARWQHPMAKCVLQRRRFVSQANPGC